MSNKLNELNIENGAIQNELKAIYDLEAIGVKIDNPEKRKEALKNASKKLSEEMHKLA